MVHHRRWQRQLRVTTTTVPLLASPSGTVPTDLHSGTGRVGMAEGRKDADRRSRQCARFARLIRIARLLMGNGRWGPEDLAREIECSVRTIFRDIEVLTVSGMPITY